jgi:hypothetical protein
LIGQIKTWKALGHTIVLWTNRGEHQKAMTYSNLGEYAKLFDSFLFFEGKKSKAGSFDGIIVDNETRFGSQGREYIEIHFGD